ncbi:MAG: glycosyltransferase family 2 protein [Candidatus Aenigmarchaeota archaeon]|nr:glycosyltransferase family 2 protein [Candidatus Aenigmarchaeota archaeon]
MHIIAVIPGYNVEKTVGKMVKETKKHVDEIIYVDDGSSDNSVKMAKKSGAKVVKLYFNHGKGFALRTGIYLALENGADVIVTLDSDGQHYPKDIPRFLEKIKESFDVVIGSRYAGKFYTFPRNVIGNFGLNFMTNLFSYGPQNLLRHKWLGDTQSGFRAFKIDAIRKMNLKAKRYEIEGEMIFEIAINNLKVKEIPIITKAKIRGVTIWDGIDNAKFLFKKRFKL